MTTTELRRRRCVPCEGGVAPLSRPEAKRLLGQIEGWRIRRGRLRRERRFKDFAAAMAFVSKMAELAEEEGHHPDFCVRYSAVDITLWTHAAGGLTENDFILAAKIEEL
jgi:4a-hydroxytetrahydrobiopterin dehydratase